MSDLAKSLQDVPWQQMFPILMVLLVGVVLWAYGHKVLRGGFAAMGLIIGGTIGYIIADGSNWSFSPWIAAAVGGVVMAVVGLIAYKIVIIGSLAAVFAAASMMGVLTFHEFSGAPTVVAATEPDTTLDGLKDLMQSHQSETDAVKSKIADAKDKITEAMGGSADGAKEKLKASVEKASDALGIDKDTAHESVERMKTLGKSLVQAVRERWEKFPQDLRTRMMWGGIIGAIVGLLIGGIFVKPAVIILTSVGGSLLWLSCAGVVAGRMGASENWWVPGSGKSWMAVWLITALIGVGIQWTFRTKSADKPA